MDSPAKYSQQKGMRMQRRSLVIPDVSFDDATQSTGLVITTPTPVRTWLPDPSWTGPANACPYIEGDEVLLASGLDYSRTPGMPLCDGHNTGRVGDILGRVDDVRPAGENVVGKALYLPEFSNIYQGVKNGFYRQISAGYTVQKYVQVERTDGVPVPLFHATDWTLLEVSHVPIGADALATVRSATPTDISIPQFEMLARSKREEPTMADTTDLSALVDAAEAAIQAVADASDDGADDATVARAAALRSFRAEGDEPEKKDEPAADETEAEKKDVEETRSLARSYGKLKLVDDLRKLGARSTELRTALRGAISNGARFNPADVKPSDQVRSAPTINTPNIYQTANSQFRGKR
ncbi:hypothetical protein NOJ16_33535 [Neorhizobium galegae]|nr:hypothetical protein [Neorhizobium galegae]